MATGVPGDPNPNFNAEAQDVCWPEDLILVIYVTGGRGEASSAADHIAGELVEHAPVLGRFPTVAFIGGIGIEPARCSGECVLTR